MVPLSRYAAQMSDKVYPIKKKEPRPNFVRAWREHRQLTLEQLGSRVGMSHASVSRVERGIQDAPISVFDQLADALGTDTASLFMRDPRDPEGIWSIWDRARPGERRQIAEVAKTIIRLRETGT